MRTRCCLILAGACLVLQAGGIRGFVSDPSGSRVPNAKLDLLDRDKVVRSTATALSGAFHLSSIPPGDFVLRVAASGFLDYTQPLHVSADATEELQVVLPAVSPVRADITVTARRGAVEDAQATPQVAVSASAERLDASDLQTAAHALDESPNVVVQQTTAGQSSPILRGLTGYQTLLLVDGIRLNTAMFRSGPNQYLSFVHPAQTDRIEAVLGPAGASFGSDSMGGTINVATAATGQERPVGGEIRFFGATSDLSAGSSARLYGRIATLSYSLGGFAQRNNNLQPGGGVDSRNSFRRYFGLEGEVVSSLLGDRLRDTSSSRDGAHAKADWRITHGQTATLWYQHSEQVGVRSYRDQLGGPGNLVSRMTPQVLDFAYARYEKMRLGPFDFVSGTLSANSQQDGSVKQALRWTDTVTTDRNSILSVGYSAQATGHIGARQAFVIGSETYRETNASTRFAFDPNSAKTVQQRAQYPDGSVYTSSALYAQDTLEAIGGRLRLTGGVRYSWIRFAAFADRNRDAAGNLLGVPDTRRRFSDVTFHSAASWQMTRQLAFHAVVSRGFRAPNLNDLGSVGMGTTTLGYEFPSEEIAPLGAQFATDSSDTSGTSGRKVTTLQAESLDNYESGVTWRSGRIYVRGQFFDAELLNPIAGRTVLFPAGSVPASLGGIPVYPLPQSATQQQQGLFAVATSLTPRAVKSTVNDGHAKYYGTEEILQVRLSSRWTAEANYSFLVGRDLNPNRPVRRLPPQQGAATLRYTPPGQRFWLEFTAQAAGAQARLNGGDIDDDRIGASRRRSDIANFFNGGFAAPWIGVGADGRRGTSDDLFLPTGETLAQIQNRVLPVGATINGVRVTGDGVRVPLYVRNAGWAVFSIRGGFPAGRRLSISFDLTNLLDKNYRVLGSGVDGPARGAFAIVRYAF